MVTASAVLCARAGCGAPRPAGATARWRFCSTACKQAAYRLRRKAGSASHEHEDEQLREALLALVARARTLTEATPPWSAQATALVGLARRVVELAAARDAGVSGG
ncbi:hypothetical protein [Actinosynnema pretiosum]|uniref:Uncharacterized protein n=2 Tax=Actinosynnema pretiosum TaxID=42197 RepID=A0A290Z6J9_9PSEU|nr:hypothetical protein [Actinosynnema pretiosum]AAM54114.1 unknown [Actinosynnema pretiosum subsp. auranticum]ATE54657.1 hypothetical protein CNX65_16360 [Actinosynnema pretiosum]